MRAWVLLALGSLLLTPVSAQGTSLVLVAHLPSSPVENAGRQAAALTALTDRLSQALPQTLETKIFRRAQDASDFLEAEGDRVALVLTEAAFLLDFSAGELLQPEFRVLREGQQTYRRLLIVKNDTGAASLAGLEGKSLSYVESSARSDGEFLARQVFQGSLDPGEWFGRLEPVPTDFSATAAVLYGQTDAALVADDNPLMRRHLGKELRQLFESPPLSLPIFSLKSGALGDEQTKSLATELVKLGKEGNGQEILGILGWSGFETLGAAARQAVLSLPEIRGKSLEIAFPAPGTLALVKPGLPAVDQLPFVVAIELPDLPLDPDEIAKEPGGVSPEVPGKPR